MLLLAAMAVLAGCSSHEGMSFLSFSLSPDYYSHSMEQIRERIKSSGNTVNLPDTNDFILSVIREDGENIYKGKYGERPVPLAAPAGNYSIGLYSVEFSGPAFSTPQFGDEWTVVLGENETVGVTFGCTQLNAGIRLLFEESFKERFFSYVPAVSSTDGNLDYGYNEKRTAFFKAGNIKITCRSEDEEIPVLSRQLEAADMLTVKLSAAGNGDGNGGGFRIMIDTSRNWIYDVFTVGSGNDGSTPEAALAVAELGTRIGAKDIWVKGYIVGGDLSTSNMVTEPPFSKASNLAIADSRNPSGREMCAGVEIPSKEEIRNALNLVNNPGNLGKVLYIKGDIEEYFGHPGIKGITEFVLE